MGPLVSLWEVWEMWRENSHVSFIYLCHNEILPIRKKKFIPWNTWMNISVKQVWRLCRLGNSFARVTDVGSGKTRTPGGTWGPREVDSLLAPEAGVEAVNDRVRCGAWRASSACSWERRRPHPSVHPCPSPLANPWTRKLAPGGPRSRYLGRCRPAWVGRAARLCAREGVALAQAVWGTCPRWTQVAGWLCAPVGAAHSHSERLWGPSFCLEMRNDKRLQYWCMNNGHVRKEPCKERSLLAPVHSNSLPSSSCLFFFFLSSFPFLVFHSVVFSIVTELCNYPHYTVPEHFHYSFF